MIMVHGKYYRLMHNDHGIAISDSVTSIMMFPCGISRGDSARHDAMLAVRATAPAGGHPCHGDQPVG
jgi:hypothetical protein